MNGQGSTISFSNRVIIMASNVRAELWLVELYDHKIKPLKTTLCKNIERTENINCESSSES